MASMAAFLAQAQAAQAAQVAQAAQAPGQNMQQLAMMMSMMQPAEQNFMLPGQNLAAHPAVQSFAMLPGQAFAAQVESPDSLQPATPLEVESFLVLNPGVEEHAKAKLRSVDPRVQRMVINRGSLEGARDPTATILGRISKGNAHFFQGSGYGKGAVGVPSLQGISSQTLNISQEAQTLEAGLPGTLKNFGERGFGYITPDDGSEIVFFPHEVRPQW